MILAAGAAASLGLASAPASFDLRSPRRRGARDRGVATAGNGRGRRTLIEWDRRMSREKLGLSLSVVLSRGLVRHPCRNAGERVVWLER